MNREKKELYKSLIREQAYFESVLAFFNQQVSKLHREVKEQNFSSLDAYTNYLHQCRKEKETAVQQAQKYCSSYEGLIIKPKLEDNE